MILKRAYYYLFYKLYKFYENSPSVWLSEWKASLSIDVLIIVVMLTLGGYYSIATKNEMIPVANPAIVIWIIGLSIAAFNYIIFNHKEKWKLIVEEFDNLPVKLNRMGTWITWVIILLIFANLIFMFYLMSQTDWK